MNKFNQYEIMGVDTPYIDPSDLSNDDLVLAHEEYMEGPINTDYWRELDGELQHRCDEGDMKWPY